MIRQALEFVSVTQSHSQILESLHSDGFPNPWMSHIFEDMLTLRNVYGFMAIVPDPAGFIMIRAAAEEAEILTLAVIPSHRRKGLGRALVKKALNHLKVFGTTVCHLEVASDNIAAQRLYRSSGFVQVGRRAGYYARQEGGMDAVLMSRRENRVGFGL